MQQPRRGGGDGGLGYPARAISPAGPQLPGPVRLQGGPCPSRVARAAGAAGGDIKRLACDSTRRRGARVLGFLLMKEAATPHCYVVRRPGTGVGAVGGECGGCVREGTCSRHGYVRASARARVRYCACHARASARVRSHGRARTGARSRVCKLVSGRARLQAERVRLGAPSPPQPNPPPNKAECVARTRSVRAALAAKGVCVTPLQRRVCGSLGASSRQAPPHPPPPAPAHATSRDPTRLRPRPGAGGPGGPDPS